MEGKGEGGRGGKCRAGVSFFLYLGLVRGREGMLVVYITDYYGFVACCCCFVMCFFGEV